MAESKPSRIPENVVNNEDVINDLTKDLESAFLTSNNTESSPTCSSKSIDVHSDSTPEEADKTIPASHPDFETGFSKKTDKNNFNPDDFDADEEEKHSDSDAEESNELALKDLEVTLTEAEKEERRMKAEKCKIEGNDRFKLMDYDLSVGSYTEGLRLCPLAFPADRAVLFSNRAAARMKLEQNNEAIKDCTKAIENDVNYIKAYYRRAQCYELTDKLDEGLADYNKILELDPQHGEARRGVLRLPPLIDERNEKLKTEMLGKLKDLGNLFLKPFGLSTANFQMTQDPETKGYSINFNQGK